MKYDHTWRAAVYGSLSTLVLVGVTAGLLGGCDRPVPPKSSVKAQKTVVASSAQIPTEDGKPLYEFLLAEIPEVIAEVPCSCCGESLKWCYQGGCPFS